MIHSTWQRPLAEKASTGLDKPVFFIWTNVYMELMIAKNDKERHFNEAFVLEKITKDCLKKFERFD